MKIYFLAFALILGADSSLAQSEDNKETELTIIEEVVVTSRNRKEKLQSVPIAVTVFSREDIEEGDIESFADFVALIPNMSFAQSLNPGNVAITVRGIGQVRNGDAPVAVVVDGITQAHPNAINIDLYDIERIEVLKGPQGGLYGRNAIGGAISIRTREPSLEPEHRVTLGLGSANETELTFASGGPLAGEKLLYRVAGLYRDRDGYQTNRTLGVDADPKRDSNVSLRLSFLPNDSLSVDLKLTGSKTRDGGGYYIPVTSGNPNETHTEPVSELLPYGERDLRDVSLALQYRRDWGTVSLQAGSNSIDEIFYADDYLPVSFLWAYQDLEVTASTQELRFTSRDDRRLRWVIGAFLLDTDRGLDTVVGIDTDSNGLFDGPFDINLVIREENDNRASAVFGQLNYDINDQLEISLAVRHDRDKREQTNALTGTQRTKRFDDLQPRLAHRWMNLDMKMVIWVFTSITRRLM